VCRGHVSHGVTRIATDEARLLQERQRRKACGAGSPTARPGDGRCASFLSGAGGRCTVWFFFFQAEDGIRDWSVTGVQTCALPISSTVISNCSRVPGRVYSRFIVASAIILFNVGDHVLVVAFPT